MCKVLITNRGNNYNNYGNPSIEVDIPTESVTLLESLFSELNTQRKSATEPCISIKKL